VIHSPPRAPLHFQRKKGKQPAKFRSRAVEIEEVRSDSTVVKLHFTYLHSRITKTRKKKDPKNPGPMRSARVANIESFITIAIPSYATHITKNTKTSLLGSCNRVCFMRFVNIPRTPYTHHAHSSPAAVGTLWYLYPFLLLPVTHPTNASHARKSHPNLAYKNQD
jgi:hypothetical protein